MLILDVSPRISIMVAGDATSGVDNRTDHEFV